MTFLKGILADVDIGSEKYRFLGDGRFYVGAILRILNFNIYRGRISFLPSSGTFIPKNPLINLINPNKVKSNVNAKSTLSLSVLSPQTKYLRPLGEPVPDDWVVIEDNFITVFVVMKPMFGVDYTVWPDCKLDNEDILLVFIKEGVTRTQLFKIFFDLETGGYLNHQHVESVRVKAFRLEPFDTHGTITIDGEVAPYGPIQGEMIPPLINCLAHKT